MARLLPYQDRRGTISEPNVMDGRLQELYLISIPTFSKAGCSSIRAVRL